MFLKSSWWEGFLKFYLLIFWLWGKGSGRKRIGRARFKELTSQSLYILYIYKYASMYIFMHKMCMCVIKIDTKT